MTLDSLLRVLADGAFHSGEELGESLGVSRSAVWKQLKKLESLGVRCHSVRGRGYRLPGGLDLLSEARIKQALSPDALAQLRKVSLSLTSGSTSSEAMLAAQQGDAQGYLYLAEQQTAGRGRRGRTWVSPFARNLYFSLVWQFSGGVASLEGLSLAVGVALARALDSYGVPAVQLKWPNDLLVEGRKLAGILLEMTGEPGGVCQVVIGVGVNVQMPDEMAEAIDQPWIDLQRAGAADIDRNALLALILEELLRVLGVFTREGFAPFVDEWQQRNAHAGREVVLETGAHTFRGCCLGVDGAGALLLETAEGCRTFHGGELSLRALS